MLTSGVYALHERESGLTVVEKPALELGVNLSVGIDCPMRCIGCYNRFPESRELISYEEILDFTAAVSELAKGMGALVVKATIAGGDPLSYPDVIPLVKGLRQKKLYVKMDTTGLPLLGDTPVLYSGYQGKERHTLVKRSIIKKVDADELVPHLDEINIPLDGIDDETIAYFRKSVGGLREKSRQVCGEIKKNRVALLGRNCVVYRYNKGQLRAIRDIAAEEGASRIQFFQFDGDPYGPNNPSKLSREEVQALTITDAEFKEATQDLESTNEISVECKSLADRADVYRIVDGAGILWKPRKDMPPLAIAHITKDRERALQEYHDYIEKRLPKAA